VKDAREPSVVDRMLDGPREERVKKGTLFDRIVSFASRGQKPPYGQTNVLLDRSSAELIDLFWQTYKASNGEKSLGIVFQLERKGRGRHKALGEIRNWEGKLDLAFEICELMETEGISFDAAIRRIDEDTSRGANYEQLKKAFGEPEEEKKGQFLGNLGK
jgi:hypothetical protein